MSKIPNNLYDKIEDGVISLDNVPFHTLVDWSSQTDDWRVKDLLGCEIMYRSKECKLNE